MNPPIRTILFDIGGTLVCKQNHGFRDLQPIAEMTQILGAESSPEDLLALLAAREQEYKAWRARNFQELSVEERWARFLLPDRPEEFVRRHAARLQELWSASRGRRWIPAETARTLRELAQRGYTLGSASHTSPRYLQEAGLGDIFRAHLHASEYGRRKPHPSIFLAAARACGALPEACAYVGNRPSRDVVGAREAGIGKVILLQPPGGETESEPCPMRADLVITRIADLLEVFPPLEHAASGGGRAGEAPRLYDAALSTMWWQKADTSPDEFFQRGRSLGFARFELNHQIPPEELDSIDLERFHIGTLHDPCPAVISAKQLEREDRVITSLDRQRREFGVGVVKRTIEEARRLGARSVVIHPGRIPGSHQMDEDLREMYRQGLKGTPEYEALRLALMADRRQRARPHLEPLLLSLREIVSFAEGSGLMLGFENRFHYYELPDFEELEVLLAEFPQPWVGWQLDVGHLKVHDELGLMDLRAWLERFGSRMVGVHLHDVCGIQDHRAPGCGNVDFCQIAAVLPPHAQRTLEIDKAVPYEEMRRGLEVLEAAGCIAQI